jgi:unsaturated rhamnogalacturonyl hydrolase
MWLDGVYMASPFLAEFASVFKEPSAFDDVATQILLAEKHMRDPKTGLLYHGWDESKEQRWANPRTGTSSQFWARSMGWYAMAVVDVLDWMPRNQPRRPQILAVLRRLATAIASVQDKASGVWWQILDAAERPRNYRESSASAMFVYALAKGIKHGWLDATFAPVVSRGYRGIIETFVVAEPDGRVGLKNICVAAGLGGNPYRDGSFEYYSSIETATDDFKGLGAFILASVVAQ